jgi:uncharacterized membrane protein YkvA (DUF1232 family)
MGMNLLKYGFILRVLKDLRLIIPLIKDILSGRYRKIPYGSLLIILFAIIYIINPFDMLPDFILGIGQIDDALILIVCLYLIEKDLSRYREWRETGNDN